MTLQERWELAKRGLTDAYANSMETVGKEFSLDEINKRTIQLLDVTVNLAEIEDEIMDQIDHTVDEDIRRELLLMVPRYQPK